MHDSKMLQASQKTSSSILPLSSPEKLRDWASRTAAESIRYVEDPKELRAPQSERDLTLAKLVIRTWSARTRGETCTVGIARHSDKNASPAVLSALDSLFRADIGLEDVSKLIAYHEGVHCRRNDFLRKLHPPADRARTPSVGQIEEGMADAISVGTLLKDAAASNNPSKLSNTLNAIRKFRDWRKGAGNSQQDHSVAVELIDRITSRFDLTRLRKMSDNDLYNEVIGLMQSSIDRRARAANRSSGRSS